MPRRPQPLPDSLGPSFTSAELRRLEIPKDRARRRDFESPFRGVHRRVTEMDRLLAGVAPNSPRAREIRHLADASALAKALPEDAFFCGITAALLWGLPVPSALLGPIEVARFRPMRVAQRAGVRGSSVAQGGVRLIRHGGIDVTDPASTWAMLGTRLSFRDLVALGDAIVRRPRIPGTDRLERPPLAELSDLHAEAGRARRRGAVRLRQAAESVRTGSASPPETFIRLELLAAGLPEPDLDVDVRDRNGRLIGCSELAYREHRLAFEYESEHHRVDRRQWNRDIEKYHDYAASGWQVIRVTGDLLHRRRSEFHRRAHEGLRKARRRADRG